MNNMWSFILLLYSIALFAALLGYAVYLQFAAVRWDEVELRFLDRLELHLTQILRLLEGADVKALLRHPNSRQQLFLDFSNYLKEDVIDLLRARKMALSSLLLVGFFFASYYLMRLKARLACGERDLRFLSAVELTLLRNLERPAA